MIIGYTLNKINKANLYYRTVAASFNSSSRQRGSEKVSLTTTQTPSVSSCSEQVMSPCSSSSIASVRWRACAQGRVRIKDPSIQNWRFKKCNTQRFTTVERDADTSSLQTGHCFFTRNHFRRHASWNTCALPQPTTHLFSEPFISRRQMLHSLPTPCMRFIRRRGLTPSLPLRGIALSLLRERSALLG